MNRTCNDCKVADATYTCMVCNADLCTRCAGGHQRNKFHTAVGPRTKCQMKQEGLKHIHAVPESGEPTEEVTTEQGDPWLRHMLEHSRKDREEKRS